MAETRTARMGLPQWSTGNPDAPSRADFNEAFLAIEQRAARYGQGTLAQRPAAGVSGRFYMVLGDATAINNGVLWYDNGSGWTAVGSSNVFTATDSASVALAVKGVSGQTANLQEWRDANGNVLAYIGPNGAASFNGAGYGGSTQLDTLNVTNTSTFGGQMTAQGASFGGTVTIQQFKSTANRSDGNPLTKMNADGSGWMDALIPPGTILMTGRTTAPTNFLMCQGQAISRTTYADLYAAIGTAYGAGDGSTTFNIPDMRDRYVIGANTKALGASDGQAAGTARNNLFAHAHGHAISSDGSHSHSISNDYSSVTIAGAGSHGHGGSTDSAGSHNHSVGNTTLSGADNTTATGSAHRVSQDTHGHGLTSNDGAHGHTFTTGSVADHVHGVSVGYHSHGGTGTSGTHSHGSSTGSGGSSDHPFTTVNYMIRF